MAFLSGVIVGGIGMALWYTVPAALAFRDVFQSGGRDVVVIDYETGDSAGTEVWDA